MTLPSVNSINSYYFFALIYALEVVKGKLARRMFVVLSMTSNQQFLHEFLHARKIGPSRTANTGRVVGVDGFVAVESYLEASYLLLLSFDPDVERFQTQPVTLRWLNEEGQTRQYTPDVLVSYRSRPTELVEVKHSKLLWRDREVLKPKFRRAYQWGHEQGFRFRVVTEKKIPETLVKNLRFLDRYRRPGLKIDQSNIALIRRAVEQTSPITPEVLLRALSNSSEQQGQLLPALWHLVATGYIKCDLLLPIGMASPISGPCGGLDP